MFVCKPKDRKQLNKLKTAFQKVIKRSRFTATVLIYGNKLKFETIRLKQAKPYCGAHAGPCQFTGIAEKHKSLKYLEGADWVAFNDMLNDVADNLYLEADIKSSVCIIRKGKLRRTQYNSFGHGDFMKDEDNYTNRCGLKPISSTYPNGTPGIATYKV